MSRYTNKKQLLLTNACEMLKWIQIRQKLTDKPLEGRYNHGTVRDHTDTLNGLIRVLSQAQTIIFPAEQIQVFLDLTKSYTDSLEYRLPYPTVLIQANTPIIFDPFGKEPVYLEAIVLQQTDMKTIGGRNLTFFGHVNNEEVAIDLSETNGPIFFNTAYFISRRTPHSGEIIMKTQWTSGVFNFMSDHLATENIFKPLAIACIGYINCENVYLEKEGEVDEKVNRKRQREGKKILEPYYVCRIKGVKYDANGHATGEGTKHGHRYDVRGHFRRYQNGITRWIPQHQRGLANELYIPKTYVVQPPKEENIKGTEEDAKQRRNS